MKEQFKVTAKIHHDTGRYCTEEIIVRADHESDAIEEAMEYCCENQSTLIQVLGCELNTDEFDGYDDEEWNDWGDRGDGVSELMNWLDDEFS